MTNLPTVTNHLGTRPTTGVWDPEPPDGYDTVWNSIHTLQSTGGGGIAAAVGDRAALVTLPSTEYATPWESIGSLYSSVGDRPTTVTNAEPDGVETQGTIWTHVNDLLLNVGSMEADIGSAPLAANGAAITTGTLWDNVKDLVVDGKVGSAPSPLVAGYTNVWESIATFQAYNATTDNAYLGARPDQFGASTRPSGYGDVWESIETLHARPTGSTTTTTGSGDASVGTKPTEARLLTEVELAPLVSSYDTLQTIDATIGLISDEKLGHAIALSKDGLTLAHAYIAGHRDPTTGVVTGGGYDLKVQVWYRRTHTYPTAVIPDGGAIGTYYTRGTLDTILVDAASFPDAYVSLALNANGSVLVIGHPFQDGYAPGAPYGGGPPYGGGVVRVYRLPVDASSHWTTLAAETISLLPTEFTSDGSGPSWSALHGYAVATNAPGSIIAVGAPGFFASSPSGDEAGLVRVYQIDNDGDWIQMGSDITGAVADNESGTSLAMSADGLTLAVGSPNHDHVDALYLDHIYYGIAPTANHSSSAHGQWSFTGWEILQNGVNIFGFTGLAGSQNTHLQNIVNDMVTNVTPAWITTNASGIGWNANYVSSTGAPNYTPLVYLEATVPLDGSQLTSNLRQYPHIWDVADSGHIVSSPDGTVGSWVVRASWTQTSIVTNYQTFNETSLLNGGITTYADVGHVRVYDYIASSVNGWVTRPGGDLLVGANAGDNVGARRSVAMSDDGLVVALGAPGFDEYDDEEHADGVATDAGKVKVWAYSTLNQAWTLRSVQMVPSSYADLQQNSVVSLSSDGTILAVGGYGNGADAATGAPTVGKVTTYDWQPDKVAGPSYYPAGSALSGVTGSKFGWSVALSSDGMTLVVGAPFHTGGGQVEVFQAVDSANEPLSGRRIGSELAPIATSYQASEYTVWSLLDLALVEIQALQLRVNTLQATVNNHGTRLDQSHHGTR